MRGCMQSAVCNRTPKLAANVLNVASDAVLASWLVKQTYKGVHGVEPEVKAVGIVSSCARVCLAAFCSCGVRGCPLELQADAVSERTTRPTALGIRMRLDRQMMPKS